MKSNLLLMLLFSLFSTIAKAQFDELFYYPHKTWDTIHQPKSTEHFFHFEQDSVYTLFCKPPHKVKASIFYFHGSGGNISEILNDVKPMIDDGFQVVLIDYRGFGLSSGSPTHVNIASDAQPIFEYYVAMKSIRKSNIIIYGTSMGTQIAAHIAANNLSRIHALILDGTISSFTDIALDTSPAEQKGVIEKYVTSPYSAKDDIKLIKGIQVLMIHSREDSGVPFSHAEKVFGLANEPKEFWIYKGEHQEAIKKYPDEFLKHLNKLNQRIQ